jgi:hypothetical protein
MTRNRLPVIVACLIVLVAAYTGFWYWAAGQLSSRVDGLIAAAPRVGITVEHGAVSRAGYPLQVALHYHQPVVTHAEPALDWTWRSDELVVAVSPFHLNQARLQSKGASRITYTRAALPAAGMPKVDGSITWDAASTTTDYDRGRVSSIRSVLRNVVTTRSDDGGRHVQYQSLILQAGPWPAAGGGAPQLAVGLRGEGMRNTEPAPGAGDNTVSLLELAGTVTTPTPMPNWRNALIKWRDDGGTLDLTTMRMAWGPVRLTGSGTLSLDELMRPIGAFSIRVKGYNWLLNQLTAAGKISATNADMARAALRGLDEEKGNADGVPLPIRMQSGHVWMGPQAIGDARPVL